MSDERIDSKEQDRYLPIANISRIMKKSLPASAKISKEAKECVQECVSEFIAFVTTSDKCKQEKRKTINGDDLLWAMGALGFDRYIEPLKAYLTKYRECAKEDNDVSDGEVEEKKVEDSIHLGYQQPLSNLSLSQMPNTISPLQESNNINAVPYTHLSLLLLLYRLFHTQDSVQI